MKFTGKFSHLKQRGYTFQRLFASNYMCWWRELKLPGKDY
jgi:hypothetical protein